MLIISFPIKASFDKKDFLSFINILGQAQNSRILDTPSAMWKSPPGGTGIANLFEAVSL